MVRFGKSLANLSPIAVSFGRAIDKFTFEISSIYFFSLLPTKTLGSLKIGAVNVSHSFLFSVSFKKLKISHFLSFENAILSSQSFVLISSIFKFNFSA